MELSVSSQPKTKLLSSRKAIHGIEKRFYLVLFWMLIWIFAQSIATFKGFDVNTNRQLLLIKNQAGVVAICLATILYFRQLKIQRIAIVGMVFTVYAFLNISAKVVINLNSLYLPLMYFFWVWGIFVVFPAVLDSKHKILFFLRFAVWGSITIVLYNTLWSFANNDYLWWGSFSVLNLNNVVFERLDRFVFGWQNPGYAGSLLAAIAIGTLYIYSLSKNEREKKLSIICFTLLIIGLLLTVARSAIVFLVVTLIILGLRNSRLRSSSILLVWFLILLPVGWLLYLSFSSTAFLDLTRLNDLSTNRLDVWQVLFSSAFSSLSGYFVGSTNYASFPGFYQDLSRAPLQIFRVDSVYLEIFLMFGAVGFALFVAFLLFALRFLIPYQQGTNTRSDWLLRNLGIAIFIGILAGSLTNSIFPSLGNLFNAMLLPAAVAIAVQSRDENRLRDKNEKAL